MSHTTSEELRTKLEFARSKVVVGGKYYHYKNPGKFYTLVEVAIYEETEEICILYRAEYKELKGTIWIRKIENFLEEIEIEGKKVKRFNLFK